MVLHNTNPTPTNIIGARSWFALINYIAWTYAITPVMQPFRELVKQNSKFTWNLTLNQLGTDSKNILLSKNAEVINSFDITSHLYLQTG